MGIKISNTRLTATNSVTSGTSFVIQNNGVVVGTAMTLNLAPGLYATITDGIATINLGTAPSAPYTYWQFVCYNGSGGYTSMQNVLFNPGSGFLVEAPAGTATSENAYGGEGAPNAFAGGLWLSSGATNPTWIQYAFAEPTGLAQISFTSRSGYPNQGPVEVIVQVSNDGINFTELLTLTPTGWVDGTSQIFAL